MMGFFFKEKSFAGLPEADVPWAGNIDNKSAPAALVAAAAHERPERLKYLMANYQFQPHVFQKAVLAAIGADRPEHLDAIFDKVNLDLLLRRGSYDLFLPDMLEAAAKIRSLRCWNRIKNRCGFERLGFMKEFGAYDYLRVAAQHDWREAAEPLFDFLPDKDGSFYGGILEIFALKSDESAMFALQWKDKFRNRAANLARALKRVVEKGHVKRAVLLIDAGANPNADSCKALQAAVAEGNIGMVDALIKKGARPDLFGQDILDALAEERPGAEAYLHFRDIVEEWKARAAVQANPGGLFSLASPHTVAEKQFLPGGGSLTILFNFATKQQMVLSRNANAVVSFDDIRSEVLEAAYEKLIELGGKAEEPLAIKKTLRK